MPKKRRSTSTLSQKLFKEIQVNDQICTNINFRKKKKTVIYLYAHYGFKYLKTVRY